MKQWSEIGVILTSQTWAWYILLQFLLSLIFKVTIKSCLYVFPSFDSTLNAIAIQGLLMQVTGWCLQSTGISKWSLFLVYFLVQGWYGSGSFNPSTVYFVAWTYVYCKCNLLPLTWLTRDWIVCCCYGWLSWQFFDYLKFKQRSLKQNCRCSQVLWFEGQVGKEWMVWVLSLGWNGNQRNSNHRNLQVCLKCELFFFSLQQVPM